MKTKWLSVLMIFFLFASNASATHYMGGEITWQCMGNGYYRFVMKLYRECNGIMYFTNETMSITNHPAITSVLMTLRPGGNPNDNLDGALDGRTELSPICWNAALQIACSPSPVTANTGAVEEWYYTSDVSYPNGIQLVGTPPAAGWIFSHIGCCRNPCSNLATPTNDSWFIRAVMYSYNGTNAYPCFDSSPVFAESPTTAICSGTPYTYYTIVNDPQNDSLSYFWAQALNGNMSTPVFYMNGYSYTSPLPSIMQDSLNVPASLDPVTGQVSFTSYTNGAFVTVTGVREYRNGIKIGEIFREFQMAIIPCIGNTPPSMEDPFYDPVSMQMVPIDTVLVGDVVDFDLTAIDYGLLPNGNPQAITFNASAPDFGAGFVDFNQGCPYPPCATLNPPPIISAMLAVASHFHWQTSCSHVNNYQTDSNFAYSTHNFYFQVNDNYCPIPAYIYKCLTVVIKVPLINPQVTMVTGSAIDISWNAFPGYTDLYYIYRAVDPGPYVLIDSTYSSAYTDMYNSVGQLCRYMIRMNLTGNCPWWSNICSTINWYGIDKADEVITANIFPNPAREELNLAVHSTEPQSLDVIVLNSLGKEVSRKVFTVAAENNEFTIPTTHLSDGIYFVRLMSKRCNEYHKVIILH